jgi:hypothetical protein
MNTPARLVVRLLALATAGEAVSLAMGAVDGGGADNPDIGAGFLVVVALGLVASVGALLDARRQALGPVVAVWAAAGTALGLVLAISAPLRHGEWHGGVDLGDLWPDAAVAVVLVATLVACAALVGGAIGVALGGRAGGGGIRPVSHA